MYGFKLVGGGGREGVKNKIFNFLLFNIMGGGGWVEWFKESFRKLLSLE